MQSRSLAKYYCVDHALAKSNGFWKVDDPTRILELIVCSELMRRRYDVFYWRSEKNLEVDFILARGHSPEVAIQVAYSIADSETEERELRALVAAKEELKIKKLFVITRYERRKIKFRGITVEVIPLIEFLLTKDLKVTAAMDAR